MVRSMGEVSSVDMVAPAPGGTATTVVLATKCIPTSTGIP